MQMPIQMLSMQLLNISFLLKEMIIYNVWYNLYILKKKEIRLEQYVK